MNPTDNEWEIEETEIATVEKTEIAKDEPTEEEKYLDNWNNFIFTLPKLTKNTENNLFLKIESILILRYLFLIIIVCYLIT